MLTIFKCCSWGP